MTSEGRRRVAIEGLRPEIDCGAFPIKRTVGEWVVVEADAFTDGHDLVSADLLYRPEDSPEDSAEGSPSPDAAWQRMRMRPVGNDRYQGEFQTTALGPYRYTVVAWVDAFRTWRRDFERRIAASQSVAVDLAIGASFVGEAAARARGEDAERLSAAAMELRSLSAEGADDEGAAVALDPELAELIARYPDLRLATRYRRELRVVVERVRARYSAWYELFPRSTSPEPGRHGTFADVERRLEDVAAMGFDVLYLPPIHPIGRAFRKGRNNTTTPTPDDPGSPWAIGGPEGGHKSIHPELGTLEDFQHLVRRAGELGLEIALDLAYQASPDHPYVEEHSEWFRRRPDGTIQYAENPPKKYQDIYPFDFEGEAWRPLWDELRSIVQFWIHQGVTIFRVDNPHTKPFDFWEWLIAETRREHPETIFLSEAFTRPKVMARLAKVGFSQSYNYFPWRNTKRELTDYLTELTRSDLKEYLRPNLWPNTPDILTEYLQVGGRPAFVIRLVLAATLGASYGLYGPAYELMKSEPREAGSEEYLNSEKYEIRHWDLGTADSLRPLVARVNQIRRANSALHSNESLRFHAIDDEQMIAYSKSPGGGESGSTILVVVNLDPHHTHSGWLDVGLDPDTTDPADSYQVRDLLSDQRYLWQGSEAFVELDPRVMPAAVFEVTRRARREGDFEYYA